MKSNQEPARRVKGVRDILPEEAAVWRDVEQTARKVFSIYGFQEIRIPIFEKTEVFVRSIGETSDIVEKEMYTFTDRGGESLTLRPEGTASVVRAYVENRMDNLAGVQKLYYTGPMFRAERPQAGRFRQFHQIGAEVFGTGNPAIDAELIVMLMDFFGKLEVEDLKVSLNSLGCPQCRPMFREALSGFLKKNMESLCADCQRRVERNPMRVLDCKSAGCKSTVSSAPSLESYLCQSCQGSLEGVKKPLFDLKIPVVIDPGLVRGLDYYSRTAFEVTSDRLGAQNAVGGGGRYDTLVEQFGGPPTPAIGFALGMERLISLLKQPGKSAAPDIYLIAIQPEAESTIFELGHRLRGGGYCVDRGYGAGKLKKLMKKADKSGARFAIIIGEDELARSTAILKDLKLGSQKEVPFDDVASSLMKNIPPRY